MTMANDPWSNMEGDNSWVEEEATQEDKVAVTNTNPHNKNEGLIKGVFAISGLFFKGAAEFLLDLIK